MKNQDCCPQVKPEEIELVRRDYSANGGWETFLAYEDPRQDILVGLLRLRKVSGAAKSRQPELQGRCSIVRELHVYGTAVAVSARDATKQQHQVSAHLLPAQPPCMYSFYQLKWFTYVSDLPCGLGHILCLTVHLFWIPQAVRWVVNWHLVQ